MAANDEQKQAVLGNMYDKKKKDDEELQSLLERAARGEADALDAIDEVASRENPYETNAPERRLGQDVINNFNQATANITGTKAIKSDLTGDMERDSAQYQKNSMDLRQRLATRGEAASTPLKQLDLKNRLMKGQRENRLDTATEPFEQSAAIEKAGALENTSRLQSAKAKSDVGQYQPGQVESNLQVANLAQKLQAQLDSLPEGSPQRAVVQQQLDQVNQELNPENTKTLDAATARRIYDDLEAQGRKAELRQVQVGDQVGYEVYDKNTGERIRAEMGTKPIPPSSGYGMQRDLDLRTRQLSKDIQDENLPELEAQFNNLEATLSKYGNDVANVPGTGRLERLVPTSILSLAGDRGEEGAKFRQQLQGMANALLKSRSGSAVTAPEQKRVLEELGQGTFSSPKQIQLKRRILNVVVSLSKVSLVLHPTVVLY